MYFFIDKISSLSETIHLEYTFQKHICTSERYSNNTLLARLQVNILIWLVIKIRIYRKVLSIYIQ